MEAVFSASRRLGRKRSLIWDHFICGRKGRPQAGGDGARGADLGQGTVLGHAKVNAETFRPDLGVIQCKRFYLKSDKMLTQSTLDLE